MNGIIHVIGGSGDHRMVKDKSSLLAALDLEDGGGVIVGTEVLCGHVVIKYL
jgi:hypothetical protein